MYCIKCGVELADSEKQCPLCGTAVFHPHLTRPEGEKQYPADPTPPPKVRPWGALLVVTMLFLAPMLITLVCNLQISRAITWSGYVIGGLLVGYIAMVLPYWFRKPNPAVFVPCNFVAVILYLWYINHAVSGNWFLSFAFPVTGAIGLIVTAVTVLTRYIRRGRMYIYAGTTIAVGLLMPLIELLLNITVHRPIAFVWSLYPLIPLMLLGIAMLLTAIIRPLKESLKKRFFV